MRLTLFYVHNPQMFVGIDSLQKTRKVLTEKIAQLNSAIDDVSSQLRAEYDANDTATASEEVEAAT